MEREALAYIAGLLDADGYFTIKRNTYHLRVRGDASCPTYSERIGIKQVEIAGIDFIHSLFPGTRGIQKPTFRNGKPLYDWQVTDKKAAAVAKAIVPFLKIKRVQAELLLELRANKNLGRNRNRIASGRTYPFKHWTGKTVQMPTYKLSPTTLALRQSLFERIKALNDIRPQQPKLG